MLRASGLTKTYNTPRGPVHALRDVEIDVPAGEFAVIKGRSGSGKTTLLLAAGGMLRPTSGWVEVHQRRLYELSGGDRAAFRAEAVGFVFQMFHLVPYLNVVENVQLNPLGKVGREDALNILDRLDLSGRAYHRPGELSAGEKQRAAIARALVTRPHLVLADEPTGNLDPDNSAAVMGFLSEYKDQGGTVVMVTHGVDADAYATRHYMMDDGALNEV